MDDRQEVAPRYREYLRLWREAGHQDPPTTGYASFVYVDESDEVAIAKATEHILFNSYEVYGRSPVGGVFSDSEDRLGPHTSENYKNLNNMDYLLERNMVFVGSPETVVNRIKAAAKEGLFNTLICEFNLGALDEQDLMRSIRTFGTQVIPALREFDPTS
jgi:alkanesulfonate monooxygenase SsuD/methylene tetrahydromethanopterin reductase-like flavin-dependent oxidoreductase (luciferase family)